MATSIAFPFSFVSGRIAVSTSSEELLTNKVISVIATQPGERVMRPSYGSNMMQFDFNLGDELDRAMMEQEAARAVSKWEPGATGITVSFDSAPDAYGNLYASISYTPASGGAGVVTQSVLIGVLNGGMVTESGVGNRLPSVGATSSNHFFGTQE